MYVDETATKYIGYTRKNFSVNLIHTIALGLYVCILYVNINK